MSSLPSDFLGVTRNQGSEDISVTQAELEFGVSAGVQFTSFARSLVPVYEEQEARLERNIRLADWAGMDVLEKALIIASRRIRISISNLQSEAEIRDAKRKSKRK